MCAIDEITKHTITSIAHEAGELALSKRNWVAVITHSPVTSHARTIMGSKVVNDLVFARSTILTSTHPVKRGNHGLVRARMASCASCGIGDGKGGTILTHVWFIIIWQFVLEGTGRTGSANVSGIDNSLRIAFFTSAIYCIAENPRVRGTINSSSIRGETEQKQKASFHIHAVAFCGAWTPLDYWTKESEDHKHFSISEKDYLTYKIKG